MTPLHGHIKIGRKAFLPVESGGDPFWNEKREFSRWEAWEFLIAAAAWGPHEFAIKGSDPIQLNRGETPPLSVRFLMRAWRWGSKKRVSAFLTSLRSRAQLRVQQRTPIGDTYLVVNYRKWQGSGDTNGDSNGDTDGDSNGDTDGYKTEAVKAVEVRIPPIGPPSKRNSQMPNDWQPTEGNRALADKLGVDLMAEFEQFRDHHQAKGSTFKRWDLALNTWLRNSKRFHPNGNGRPADPSQLVADLLYLIEQGGPGLDIAELRAVEFDRLAAEYPENWGRAGVVMRKLRLGRIRDCRERDREHEVWLQVRQLNGGGHA